MFKKVLIHTRRSIKLLVLMLVAIFVILGIVASFYKVSYSVNIGGESVGYTDNKSKLQSKINEYIEKGEAEHTAFVQVDCLPEYNICLLKRDVKASDDEIFDKIKAEGTTYYRYYAILDNQEEKMYVSTFTDAENIVNQLKEKKSTNIDNITITEKYETELKEMASVDDAVSKLYIEPKKVVVASKNTSTKVKASGSVNTGYCNINWNSSCSGCFRNCYFFWMERFLW